MSNEALVKAGLLSTAEATLDDAVSVAASRYTALKEDSVKLKAANAKITELEAEKQSLENKVQASLETEAKAIVAEAVKAGRLAPKDETSQDFWTKQLLENREDAEKALNSIQAKNEHVTKTVVKSGENAKGGDDVQVQAANMVKAGNAASKDEALNKIFAANPAAYEDYLNSITNVEE